VAQDRAKEGVRLPYVLRHFDVSYLGICAPHVWIYCVAHRAGLDFGGVVIGIPLYIALSAFMLAVMLLAWKGKAQRVAPKLDWPLGALQAGGAPPPPAPLRSFLQRFSGGARFRQRGDAAQLSLDLTCAHAHQALQRVARLIDARLRLFQRRAERFKLGFHTAQNIPHFTGPLLDGQRLEAHLQAG